MLYLWDPITNEKKETSYDVVEGITGITRCNLSSMKTKRRIIKSINNYLIDDSFSRQELFNLMQNQILDNEEWRNIAGTNYKYQVSNYGRVRKKFTNHTRLLTPFCRRDTICVKITVNNTSKAKRISRLVADAFIKIKKNDCVFHCDGNKYNNNVDNLQIVNRHEIAKKTSHKARAIPIIKVDPLTLEELDYYESSAEAARENYTTRTNINSCINGKQKTAVGYYWVIDYEFYSRRG